MTDRSAGDRDLVDAADGLPERSQVRGALAPEASRGSGDLDAFADELEARISQKRANRSRMPAPPGASERSDLSKVVGGAKRSLPPPPPPSVSSAPQPAPPPPAPSARRPSLPPPSGVQVSAPPPPPSAARASAPPPLPVEAPPPPPPIDKPRADTEVDLSWDDEEDENTPPQGLPAMPAAAASAPLPPAARVSAPPAPPASAARSSAPPVPPPLPAPPSASAAPLPPAPLLAPPAVSAPPAPPALQGAAPLPAAPRMSAPPVPPPPGAASGSLPPLTRPSAAPAALAPRSVMPPSLTSSRAPVVPPPSARISAPQISAPAPARPQQLTEPALRVSTPSVRPMAADAEFRPRSRAPLYIAMVAVLGLGALGAAMLLKPSKGTLVVSVAGAGATDEVRVFIDGQQQCSITPCKVMVDSGSHYVKVTSGQRSAEASGAIQVDSGDVRAVDLTLAGAPPPSSTASASATTAEATAQAPKPTATAADPAATAASTDSLSLDALPTDAPAHAGRTGGATHATGAKTPAPAPAAGKGLLNINSVPVSKILLDGRPLGQTPKVGVSVAVGPHTVVFVNPEKGRKVVTVNVRAGATSMALTRF